MTHTPGPWSFGTASGEIYAHGVSICRVYPGMLTSFHAPDVETQRANARLIAASPALLEACERLLEMITDNRLHGPEVYEAAEVISAAKGD